MAEKEKIKPIIDVKNLNVTYFLGRKNEVPALQNVSLSIYPGEFIIFFGPSGCGKSTLLYSIAGLETHAQGTVIVDGKNIAEMNENEIAKYRQKKIAMVFQAFYLISSLNVLKNVALPQTAIKVSRNERIKRAQDLLEHFGVGPQAKKLPTELSGGQQQRVAICRALVNNPDIVFADEPVGNLDSKSSADVMKLISELNEKENKTVILVTHDPAHLHMAHRVFYMRDGKIIDTKVNRAVNPEVSKVIGKEQIPSISKELELLIRTYSSIAPGQLGTMLIPFKAKQIVSEVLTGMSIEDVEKIEREVQHMLISSFVKKSTFVDFLDRPKKDGGLEMDRRTAKKLGNKTQKIVSEIKFLQKQEKVLEKKGIKHDSKEVADVRDYLMEVTGIILKNDKALEILTEAVAKRLNEKIDKKAVQVMLDIPIKDGGVGLDKRIARKAARKLELIILGKYST